jgi:hypothetical protein
VVGLRRGAAAIPSSPVPRRTLTGSGTTLLSGTREISTRSSSMVSPLSGCVAAVTKLNVGAPPSSAALRSISPQ